MALTNWSISEETLISISHYYAPFYLFNMTLANIVNLLIIVATIRSKKLRSMCNILIALQAAADAMVTWEVPIYVYHVYMRKFISVEQCFMVQVVPWLAMNFTTCFILVLGLDRYLCVKYATWYMTLNKVKYFSLLMLICTFYSIVASIGMYMSTSEQKVLCFLADAMAGRGKEMWGLSQALINVAVIIVYGKLKKFLECRSTRSVDDRDTRKIFKSLYLIVVFYIFGWVTSVFLLLAVRVLIADPLLEQAAGQFLGVFAATNLTIPFFVYFTQSVVYKREILRLFLSERRIAQIAPDSQTFGSSGSTARAHQNEESVVA
ncbi:hypothetical protein QR680_015025 [Steinernema hermaphroditum]|uniref:G-protein coupled receptors family 1 profile domain-containing protein n=1 Tax=Steinernema hermaphroditum TaxID=289476 RepID=A0AA39ID45_9BILA|nr:hypothetical protein QR680_015025 [Steinernema hermaphroditum]